MSEESSKIAIVGLAGRFPGARSAGELWRNLRAGREAMRRLDEAEALRRGALPEQLKDPSWVPVVSEMADVECFDATFFGFNHREAEYLDPQQRVFLECAWEALEDAGLAPQALAGSATGVFGGATTNTYLLFHLLPHARGAKAWDPMSLLISNAVDTLSTRVAYKLDFQGPAFTVQCACSTSLVAVHLACESLLAEECDLALAGGVSINVHLRRGYRYEKGSIASPDGRCRAFDAAGRGSIFGSGAGVVVLKRLEDALADGDPIRAVVLGSAVVNDGGRKVGYTAPGVEGQAKVIREALEVSGVDAETITYIEAHGTATALGDPIEIQALTRAFGEKTAKKQFAAIGSVKTNFGHLDVAAGIAGLIKTVLALENKEIPPSLHFETPNPQIDFASSPVYVARELQAWPSPDGVRRAGVSSFGIGGTNAHVIVEEAPEREASGPSRPFQLLVFSARRREALPEMAGRLADHLESRPDDAADLADVAHTLRTGRSAFEHRRMLTCGSREEAVRILRGDEAERLLGATPPPGGRQPSFLLPGIGEHYPGMARGLYRGEPAFRAAFDRCAEIAAAHLGRDLREVLYPEGSEETAAGAGGKLDLRALLGRSPQAADLGELAETRFAHPAIFAVEYALAQQWASWGVRPRAMIGHSLGEYVAATLAGVISLEEVLPLVVRRARRIDELPPGAMLAVSLPEAETVPRLGDGLSLAAVNSSGISVVAGREEAVMELAESLAEEGVACTRLGARHAFHSALMEPVAEAVVAGFRECELHAPKIPFVSNVTGRFITDGEATDPEYWARHLCRTVRFADGLGELLAQGGTALVEVGPGQGLGALALSAPEAAPEARQGKTVVVATLRGRHEPVADQAFLLDAFGRLWLAGVEVDLDAFDQGERRRRVALPSYPFERHRYWIEAESSAPASGTEVRERPGEGEPAAAPGPPAGSLHARPELVTEYVAPRTDLERQIARVWQEMLGVDAVGIHDSFIDLGGHSLLATQLAARLREAFQVEIPLEHLFLGNTVARLAKTVETVQWATRQGPPSGEPDAGLEEGEI